MARLQPSIGCKTSVGEAAGDKETQGSCRIVDIYLFDLFA